MSKPKKKGGDGVGTLQERKLGRPLKIRLPGEEILSNGLYERQQEWLLRESAAKGMEAAPYLRFIVDLHIDAIEKSRSDPVATPEDDRIFEQLVKSPQVKVLKSAKDKRKNHK